MHPKLHSRDISAASMPKSTSILFKGVTPLWAVPLENRWVLSKILLVLGQTVPWGWEIRLWARLGRRMVIRSTFKLQLSPEFPNLKNRQIEQLEWESTGSWASFRRLWFQTHPKERVWSIVRAQMPPGSVQTRYPFPAGFYSWHFHRSEVEFRFALAIGWNRTIWTVYKLPIAQKY